MSKGGLFYWILGAFVFAYIFIRAITVGVTYDEAWTLMDFVPLSLSDVFLCNPCDANNHLLNTLLIKLSYLFSPDTLFWARFPNLLAGLLYISMAALISRGVVKGMLGYSLYLLLILNPFLLDFFSLARGYGLAIGLLLAAIYYLLRLVQSKEFRYVWLSLTFASLAVLSNYAVLSAWLGVVFVILWSCFSCSGRMFTKALGTSLIFALFLSGIMYVPVGKMLEQGSLYFGGTEGFYQDTVNSLLRYTLYDPYAYTTAHILGVVLIVLMLANLLFGGFTKRIKAFQVDTAMALLLLLLLPVAVNILQHFILGTPYLVARTALFYYSLFMLAFVFWLKVVRIQLYSKAIAVLLTLTVLVNFAINANFLKAITWEFDSHNRKILQTISDQNSENKRVAIGGVKLFIRGVLYQIDDFENLSYVPEQNVEDSVSTDYFLYYGRDLPRIGYLAQKVEFLEYRRDTVISFPEEGLYVFKNFRKR